MKKNKRFLLKEFLKIKTAGERMAVTVLSTIIVSSCVVIVVKIIDFYNVPPKRENNLLITEPGTNSGLNK